MASRIYIPSSGTPLLGTLGFSAGWNKTTVAIRVPGVIGTKQNTAYVTKNFLSSATSPEFHLGVQIQIPNLEAQTISGTLKGQIGAFQNNALFNGTVAIGARVFSSDGLTLRGTLLAPVGSDAVTTPPQLTVGSTFINRPFMDVLESAALTLTSVVAQANDVLVIEIGVRDADTGTTRSGNIQLGDVLGNSDAPEDSTSDCTALNAWVEFSGTILSNRGIGVSSGLATATAVGAGAAVSPGASAGTSTVLGTGRATAVAVGTATGTSGVTGISTVIGVAAGTSTATAVGSAIKVGVGAAPGISSATAVSSTPRGKIVFAIEALLSGDGSFINQAMANMAFIGGGGGWTDLTSDLVGGSESVTLQYGITGTTPADRTASTGELSFALNNDVSNSAHLAGYYSPFGPNLRSGFDFNIPIRCRIDFEGVTTYKFYGSLADIVPIVAEFNITQCRVLDIFDDFARIDEPEVPIQLAKRGDEILTAIFDAMTTQPVTRDFEVGLETYSIALDGGTGQKLKVRERINQINLSEFGYCYPVGDTIGGGTVRWESRHHRAANPTVKFALTDADVGFDGSFSVSGSRDDFYRSVQVTVFPTNDLVITPISVLFALQTTQTSVRAGETNDSIFGPYRDAVSNDQVGGTQTVDPVATTDYTMNTAADGSGTDLTAFFTVTSSRTAAGVRFTITNTGTQDGFITKLQQRGKAIFRYEVLLDALVSGNYGDQILELAMPFQNNANVGKDVADYLASTLSQSYPMLPPIRFLASRDAAHLHAAFELEPGDRISVTESVIGLIAREYTINAVQLEFTPEQLIWCTWRLEPATAQRFWLVGVVGSGEIGINTFFGF